MSPLEKLVFLLQTSCKRVHLLQATAQAISHGHLLSPLFSPTLLWNLLFKGHTLHNHHLQTLSLFSTMHSNGTSPDCYSFTFILKSCAHLSALSFAMAIHSLTSKTAFQSNRFVATLLINAYSPDCTAARRLFDEMLNANAVAWTALVAAHIAAREFVAARGYFEQAVAAGAADVVLWNTVVCGYIEAGDIASAREVFERMPERDTMAWNSLLHGYAVTGELEECERLFRSMPERNIFSWNGLLRGYRRHGRLVEALVLFSRLLQAGPQARPNEASLAVALSACAEAGALVVGRKLHLQAEARGLAAATHVANAAADMYAKCGDLAAALAVFRRTRGRDVVSWNTAIGSLAAHGRGTGAIELFREMEGDRVGPDGITYVAVLSACAHEGRVEEGIALFESMVRDKKISPWIEHYGCVVDMLARAGHVWEAVRVVEKMPVEADSVIWTTLLAHGPVKLAEAAAQRVALARPEDAGNWVALSNVYGASGKWEEFAVAKRRMKETGSDKSPGRSSVEVNGRVFEFCSGDSRLTDEIDWALALLQLHCSSLEIEMENYCFPKQGCG